MQDSVIVITETLKIIKLVAVNRLKDNEPMVNTNVRVEK